MNAVGGPHSDNSRDHLPRASPSGGCHETGSHCVLGSGEVYGAQHTRPPRNQIEFQNKNPLNCNLDLASWWQRIAWHRQSLASLTSAAPLGVLGKDYRKLTPLSVFFFSLCVGNQPPKSKSDLFYLYWSNRSGLHLALSRVCEHNKQSQRTPSSWDKCYKPLYMGTGQSSGQNSPFQFHLFLCAVQSSSSNKPILNSRDMFSSTYLYNLISSG